MSLIDSLLGAIMKLDGDSLVLHTGEKPYVVTSSSAMNAFRGPLAWGQVELSTKTLTVAAVTAMLQQLFTDDQRRILNEMGAVEHLLPATDDRPAFNVVAACGGDDIWVEIRSLRPAAPVAEPAAASAAPLPPAGEPAGQMEATPAAAAPDATAGPTLEVVPEVEQEQPDAAAVAALFAASGLAGAARQEEGAAAAAASAQPVVNVSALEQEVANLSAAREEAELVEAMTREEASRVEALREEASRVEALREEASRLEASRDEAFRAAAAARAEAERVEADARAAAETAQAAAREEAARLEALRSETARLDAMREEAGRLEALVSEHAASLEVLRQQAAELEAARAEAARVEAAAREEALRVEALREEAERLEAARVEAARVEAAAREQAERVSLLQAEAARLDEARQQAEHAVAAAEEASARVHALREETARLEAARDQADHARAAAEQEAARVQALREEAARLEAARDEAVRVESAAREEAARLELLRAEAARLEAAREEASRMETAVREEGARLEALRAEAARLDLARKEAARAEAEARAEAARMQALRDEAACLEAAAREEAARVQAMAREEAARARAMHDEVANLEAAARKESSRLAEATRVQAGELEAARAERAELAEAVRAHTERLEEAQRAAAEADERRVAAERSESARAEAAREAEHLEQARLEELRAEAGRLEAARRGELALLEAARVEAVRLRLEREEARASEQARRDGDDRLQAVIAGVDLPDDDRPAVSPLPAAAPLSRETTRPDETPSPDIAAPAGAATTGAGARTGPVPAEARQANVLPLVRALREQPVGTSAPSGSTAPDLDRLLRIAAARGASGLYLVSRSHPAVRVDGDMQPLDGEEPLAAADVEAFMLALVPEPNRDSVRSGATVEWFCEVPDIGRVRCLSFRDHRGPGLIIRMLPARAVSADQLGLSKDIQALSAQPDGLVLIAGPRASGKSTTLAAFVDLINRTRADHVITIERQVTFVHDSERAFVSQREVRGEAHEVVGAVRAALREDPDVLVVEELRSPEVVAAVLEAAESGRLVLAGLRAPASADAVERLMDQVTAARRPHALSALSTSLRGVISQVLLRKRSGGRVAARELLLNTPAAAAVLAEGKLFQLGAALESGRKLGSLPLNDALAALIRDGVVDPAEAWRKAYDREGLLTLLKREGVDTSFVERLA